MTNHQKRQPLIVYLCKCGHSVLQHEQCRLKYQPCHWRECNCKDYYFDKELVIP